MRITVVGAAIVIVSVIVLVRVLRTRADLHGSDVEPRVGD